MWFLVYSIVGILFTLAAVYYDIKTRIIPKEISLGLLGLAISLHFLQSALSGNPSALFSSVISAIIAYVFLYIVWLFGLISGGDAKLLVALNALFPQVKNTFNLISQYHLSFLPIIWDGLLIILVPLLLYLIVKQRTSILPIIWHNIVRSVGYSFLVYSVFSFYTGKVAILLLFVLSFLPMKWLILLPAGVATALQFGWQGLFMTFIYLLSISLVFDILFSSRTLLKSRVRVDELKEGDILADIICDGATCPATLFNTIKFFGRGIIPRSRGLTQSEINDIKSMGIKRVYIQKSLPFTPIILLGLLTLLTLGDLIWLGVKLL